MRLLGIRVANWLGIDNAFASVLWRFFRVGVAALVVQLLLWLTNGMPVVDIRAFFVAPVLTAVVAAVDKWLRGLGEPPEITE